VPPENTPERMMTGTSQIFFKPDLSASGVKKRDERTKPNPVTMTRLPVWTLLRSKVFIKIGNRKEMAFLSSNTRPQVRANRTPIVF
jgi:hypothetical protein